MRLTAGRERAVHRVEGDIIDGVNQGLVFRVGCRVATVALEREIVSIRAYQLPIRSVHRYETYWESFSSTYLNNGA